MAFANIGVAVAAGLIPANRQRAPNIRRESFTSDESIALAIRLTDAEVRTVTAEFHQWRIQGLAGRSDVTTSEKSVIQFLSYLARGGYFHQLGIAHGVAKCTFMFHVKQVAEFFANDAHRHIMLPQAAEYQHLSIELQDPYNQQVFDYYKVILYIDGFIVRIQRPDHAGDAYFCGRHGKSCDSINVQYITDRHGRIRHVITGLSGSTHDKTAAAWSHDLVQFLNNLPQGYVILGDPAYRGLHPRVITTCTGNNLSRDQIAFNNACVRIRQIVERTIGASQLKWRVQQLKENRLAAKMGVLFASRCTIAAAVLHNRFTNFL